MSTTTTPAPTRRLCREHGCVLLHQMLRIRRFEEKCAELYSGGKIRGFLHLYVGEEAVAVGAVQALTREDAIVATYREHGHAIARGLSMNALMAEMFGKRDGCSRGRGGSMHVFDAATRFYGGNAIVGGGLPLAVGLALADALQQRPRVTACFFGDGAVAEGEFHESLNLAALWKLPVLFLCENNLYAMGTHITRAQSETDLRLKAQSYRVPAEAVDGMDVTAVEAAVRRSADAVRRGRRARVSRAAHVPLPRALDVRRRALSREIRGRGVEGARPDRQLPGAARGRGACDRRARRGARGRRGRGDRRGRGVRRGEPVGAGGGSAEGRLHGAVIDHDDLSRRAAHGAPGSAPEGPAGLSHGRGRRPLRRMRTPSARGCSPSSGRIGFATRRCRSRRLSARASARRSAACGRSWR